MAPPSPSYLSLSLSLSLSLLLAHLRPTAGAWPRNSSAAPWPVDTHREPELSKEWVAQHKGMLPGMTREEFDEIIPPNPDSGYPPRLFEVPDKECLYESDPHVLGEEFHIVTPTFGEDPRASKSCSGWYSASYLNLPMHMYNWWNHPTCDRLKASVQSIRQMVCVMIMLRDILEGLKLRDNAIVAIIDSDVFYQASSEEIVRAFKRVNRDIIVATEVTCSNAYLNSRGVDCAQEWAKAKGPEGSFINSGLILCRFKQCKQLMNAMVMLEEVGNPRSRIHGSGDQDWLQALYALNQQKQGLSGPTQHCLHAQHLAQANSELPELDIYLDTEREFMFCAQDFFQPDRYSYAANPSLHGGRYGGMTVTDKVTGRTWEPMIMHWNGNGGAVPSKPYPATVMLEKLPWAKCAHPRTMGCVNGLVMPIGAGCKQGSHYVCQDTEAHRVSWFNTDLWLGKRGNKKFQCEIRVVEAKVNKWPQPDCESPSFSAQRRPQQDRLERLRRSRQLRQQGQGQVPLTPPSHTNPQKQGGNEEERGSVRILKETIRTLNQKNLELRNLLRAKEQGEKAQDGGKGVTEGEAQHLERDRPDPTRGELRRRRRERAI